MSEPSSTPDLQQKYRQFVEIEPLAAALAGLPVSGARLFSEEQVDARAITIRSAYRVARALVDELVAGDPQRQRQLLDLMPLTIALAGLPPSESRLFSEEQVEARAMTVRSAYRIARAVAREYLGGS